MLLSESRSTVYYGQRHTMAKLLGYDSIVRWPASTPGRAVGVKQ